MPLKLLGLGCLWVAVTVISLPWFIRAKKIELNQFNSNLKKKKTPCPTIKWQSWTSKPRRYKTSDMKYY